MGMRHDHRFFSGRVSRKRLEKLLEEESVMTFQFQLDGEDDEEEEVNNDNEENPVDFYYNTRIPV